MISTHARARGAYYRAIMICGAIVSNLRFHEINTDLIAGDVAVRRADDFSNGTAFCSPRGKWYRRKTVFGHRPRRTDRGRHRAVIVFPYTVHRSPRDECYIGRARREEGTGSYFVFFVFFFSHSVQKIKQQSICVSSPVTGGLRRTHAQVPQATSAWNKQKKPCGFFLSPYVYLFGHTAQHHGTVVGHTTTTTTTSTATTQ